jgi:hypothetical protein
MGQSVRTSTYVQFAGMAYADTGNLLTLEMIAQPIRISEPWQYWF